MKDFAAVCAYFNPCGYASRRRNYNAFRQNMEGSGVELLTVELLFDHQDNSELGPYGDVVTIRGGDVMWQKERLLQIGIDRLLAEGCSAIGWVDADVSFHSHTWHENVLQSLDEFDCVQPFDQLVSHYPEGRLVRPAFGKDRRSWAHGASWAATAQFWRHVKLYQHCVVGGADTVMAAAFSQFRDGEPTFRWPANNPVLDQINQAMRAHVAEWAEQSWGAWRIGYVPQQTAHLLPHGNRRDRGYVERWQLLHDYDPGSDVAAAELEGLRWCSDKKLLHDRVRDYFFARREDG